MVPTGSIAEARAFLDAARARGERVGFVPTMGALHEGHLSLVRRARAECDTVVVSIFVNPTQFGPDENLAAYPRTLDDDLTVCGREGVGLVFHPTADEMYPQPPRTRVSVDGLIEPMEGRFRPGHFDGVALVCAKLFSIIGPCRAYFGEKDAQQLRVVRRMAQDLALPVELVGCPTVRDADGLALSSRNVYLSPAERQRALALPAALFAVQRSIDGGERDPDVLREQALGHLEDVVVDYFEIVDPDTLEAVQRIRGTVLLCGGVRVGATRLIDNVTAVPAEAAAQGIREELKA